MVKNVKRYLKQHKKNGGSMDDMDFLPVTFLLPQVSKTKQIPKLHSLEYAYH